MPEEERGLYAWDLTNGFTVIGLSGKEDSPCIIVTEYGVWRTGEISSCDTDYIATAKRFYGKAREKNRITLPKDESGKIGLEQVVMIHNLGPMKG